MSAALTLPWIAGATAVAVAAGVLAAWRLAVGFSRSHSGSVRHWAGQDLAELFLFVDPARAARASAIALLAVPLLGVAAGAPAWLIVTLWIGALVAPRAVSARLRRRRRRRIATQLPDAADALASALRGGAGLSQCMALLAQHQRPPLREELSLLLRQQRLGVSLDESLAHWSARAHCADVAQFCATVRVARELGGGLGDALQRFSSAVRRRRAIEDKIDALTSQGRMQGVIVSLLPMLLILALWLLEPRATASLFATPAGWATLTVVIALQAAGWILIRRIVRIEV